jgi:hypothetical protein
VVVGWVVVGSGEGGAEVGSVVAAVVRGAGVTGSPGVLLSSPPACTIR